MKRNYLFLIAFLFVVCATMLLASEHVFDEREKQPSPTPKRVERLLPHFAP